MKHLYISYKRSFRKYCSINIRTDVISRIMESGRDSLSIILKTTRKSTPVFVTLSLKLWFIFNVIISCCSFYWFIVRHGPVNWSRIPDWASWPDSPRSMSTKSALQALKTSSRPRYIFTFDLSSCKSRPSSVSFLRLNTFLKHLILSNTRKKKYSFLSNLVQAVIVQLQAQHAFPIYICTHIHIILNDRWLGPESYLSVSCTLKKKYMRESVTFGRVAFISFFSFVLFADRAAPKGLKVRGRDSHGTGGAETGGGRKGGEARAIPAESRDLWQIIAKRKEKERESGNSWLAH